MRDGWVIRRRRDSELIFETITIPYLNTQRDPKKKEITLEDILGEAEYKKRFGESNKRPTLDEIYKEFF